MDLEKFRSEFLFTWSLLLVLVKRKLEWELKRSSDLNVWRWKWNGKWLGTVVIHKSRDWWGQTKNETAEIQEGRNSTTTHWLTKKAR
jgi:hypothetical protein